MPFIGFATDATPRLIPTRRTVVGGRLAADAASRHDSVAAANTAARVIRPINSGRDPDGSIYAFFVIGGSSIISAQSPAGFRFEPLLMTVIFMIISYAATVGEAAALLATSCASAMTADSKAGL